MRKVGRIFGFWAAIMMLLATASCSMDDYETGDGDYSYLCAEFADARSGEGGMMKYYMSILKREPAEMDQVNRYTFQYANCTPGVGRFIHTYMSDGDPLPSFTGEPKPVKIEGNIERFTKMLWESLNEENKVSLFVRYITLSSGEYVSAIMNKHQIQ